MDRMPLPAGIPAPPLPEPDDNLYVIHYSQERAEDCTAATPGVSAIVVQHFLTSDQRTFAALHVAEREGIPTAEWPTRLEELERRLLEDFVAFAAQRPRAIWLHWGMRGSCFGFEVLSHRALRHGLKPAEITPDRRFDLANHLKRTYGTDYAPHPRLWHASRCNGAAGPGFLNEPESTEAWATGRHAALLRSLSSKAHAIARLYELVCEGAFRIGGVEPTASEMPVPVRLASAEEDNVLRCRGDVRLPMSVTEMVEALRSAGKKGRHLPAALVEFMAHRKSAPVEEVIEEVHGCRGDDCRRVYANLRRTNRELERMGADIRFRQSGGYVLKVVAGSVEAGPPNCR